MQAYEIQGEDGIDALALVERESPEPGPGQVKLRVAASAINYRDLNTIRYPGRIGLAFPRIPNSDASGEIVAVGPGVERTKPGDRVAGCFFQDWSSGAVAAPVMASALGGALDGVLAGEVVLNERGVVLRVFGVELQRGAGQVAFRDGAACRGRVEGRAEGGLEVRGEVRFVVFGPGEGRADGLHEA